MSWIVANGASSAGIVLSPGPGGGEAGEAAADWPAAPPGEARRAGIPGTGGPPAGGGGGVGGGRHLGDTGGRPVGGRQGGVLVAQAAGVKERDPHRRPFLERERADDRAEPLRELAGEPALRRPVAVAQLVVDDDPAV